MIRNHLLTLLFGISACYVENSVALEAIVGGHRAEDDQFKYQVSVQNDGEHFCGGSIVAKKYILTAAGCVIGKHGAILYHNLTVLAGTNDLRKKSEPAVTRQVHKIYTPVDFDPTTQAYGSIGDIAMLELYEDLPLRNIRHFRFLEVPPSHADTYDDAAAIISGWGWTWINVVNRTEIVGGTHDSRLQWAKATILSPNHSCYRRRTVNSKKTICARLEQSIAHARGVCHGDAGSPLVLFGTTIIGVVSVGPFDCSETLSGTTYTRVSEYRAFIRTVKIKKIIKTVREYVLPNPPSPGSSLGTNA